MAQPLSAERRAVKMDTAFGPMYRSRYYGNDMLLLNVNSVHSKCNNEGSVSYNVHDGQKISRKLLSIKIRQILTDFQSCFIGTFCGKFVIRWRLNGLPHLNYVTALPCEIYYIKICKIHQFYFLLFHIFFLATLCNKRICMYVCV